MLPAPINEGGYRQVNQVFDPPTNERKSLTGKILDIRREIERVADLDEVEFFLCGLYLLARKPAN